MELFFRKCRGKNAISYLIKVKNYSFLEGLETIIGNVNVKQSVIYKQEKQVLSQEKVQCPTLIIFGDKNNANIKSAYILIHLYNL